MEWIQTLTTVDYIILGALAVALFVGWLRGLVEVLTGFLVFAVSTVIAGQYTDEAVNWLNRTWNLTERVAAIFARQIRFPQEAYKIQLGSIPPQKAAAWLENVPIPGSYRETLAQRLADWSASAGNETAASFLIHHLAVGVLSTVVFIVFVTLLGSLLGVAGALISDRIKALPLVGTANSVLGAAAIGFEATIFAALAVGLLVPVLAMYGVTAPAQWLESSRVAPYCLEFYGWLRGLLFGLTKGTFFAS